MLKIIYTDDNIEVFVKNVVLSHAFYFARVFKKRLVCIGIKN